MNDTLDITSIDLFSPVQTKLVPEEEIPDQPLQWNEELFINTENCDQTKTNDPFNNPPCDPFNDKTNCNPYLDTKIVDPFNDPACKKMMIKKNKNPFGIDVRKMSQEIMSTSEDSSPSGTPIMSSRKSCNYNPYKRRVKHQLSLSSNFMENIETEDEGVVRLNKLRELKMKRKAKKSKSFCIATTKYTQQRYRDQFKDLSSSKKLQLFMGVISNKPDSLDRIVEQTSISRNICNRMQRIKDNGGYVAVNQSNAFRSMQNALN